MRHIVLTMIVAAVSIATHAQNFSSVVEIVSVHSQNEKFFLRSTPYDNETPSLPGHTEVFAKGSAVPLYTVPRAFDGVDDDGNNLILSDDGQTIFYLISRRPNEEKDPLKSISIYRRGELIRSFTVSEITGCDMDKERCDLAYSNWDEVVDREKSKAGTRFYKKVFKSGVSDQEKFLSDFPVFSFNDLVYLVDSKRMLHTFDLTQARYLGSRPFADAYNEIKSKGRRVKTELRRLDVPFYPEFPQLRSGVSTRHALAKALGMAVYDDRRTADEKYKKHAMTVTGYLHSDGSFELTTIDVFTGELPEAKVRAFFASNKFASTLVPDPIDRWLIKESYFYFRRSDPRLGIKERQLEKREERAALQKRLVAESIEGRYIPKNLHEAFIELDNELSEINKKEMIALKSRKDMITYHMGLGMWMRNNWGLWGGSRLQKYFTGKAIYHPDDMSSVILFYYWDWLHGNKNSWKEWENDPKQKLF